MEEIKTLETKKILRKLHQKILLLYYSVFTFFFIVFIVFFFYSVFTLFL